MKVMTKERIRDFAITMGLALTSIAVTLAAIIAVAKAIQWAL